MRVFFPRYSLVWLVAISLPLTCLGQQQPAKKKSRRPASLSSSVATSPSGSYSKTGIPLLPDGSPDYSRYPNPFVVKGWTFEAQGATGKTGETGYGEFGVGANAYFYRWLAWRNILFYRPANSDTGAAPIYGLDMSERMSYEFSRSSGFAAFASPGFRFSGGGNSAPFAEAGFLVRIASLRIGIGGRGLARSWIQSGGANETQFFLNIGTGGP